MLDKGYYISIFVEILLSCYITYNISCNPTVSRHASALAITVPPEITVDSLTQPWNWLKCDPKTKDVCV